MLITTSYSDRPTRLEPVFVSVSGSQRDSTFLSSTSGGYDDSSNFFRILSVFIVDFWQSHLIGINILAVNIIWIFMNYKKFTFTGEASISSVPCGFAYLTFPAWIIFTHVQVACFQWIHCQIVEEKTIKISMRISFGEQSIGKCPSEKWTCWFTRLLIMLR